MIEQSGLANLLSHMQFYGLRVEVLRVSDTVEAGNAGNHDDIAPAGHEG